MVVNVIGLKSNLQLPTITVITLANQTNKDEMTDSRPDANIRIENTLGLMFHIIRVQYRGCGPPVDDHCSKHLLLNQ